MRRALFGKTRGGGKSTTFTERKILSNRGGVMGTSKGGIKTGEKRTRGTSKKGETMKKDIKNKKQLRFTPGRKGQNR